MFEGISSSPAKNKKKKYISIQSSTDCSLNKIKSSLTNTDALLELIQQAETSSCTLLQVTFWDEDNFVPLSKANGHRCAHACAAFVP